MNWFSRLVLSSNTSLFCLLVLTFSPFCQGEEGTEKPSADTEERQPSFKPPEGAIRLAKEHDVWANMKTKQVIVDGYVCLDRGQLEMFACPKGTKEHESVVAVNAPARFVHAGLLAIGIKQGTPVQYSPEYKPASGPKIEIQIVYHGAEGQQKTVRAQSWVRNVVTEKPMAHDWVFVGSDFWVDANTKKRHYLADDGDFICVSNFATATLDLPVESSANASGLLFEALTDNIPPRKTNVRLILSEKKENKKAEKTSDDAKTKSKANSPKKEKQKKEQEGK